MKTGKIIPIITIIAATVFLYVGACGIGAQAQPVVVNPSKVAVIEVSVDNFIGSDASDADVITIEEQDVALSGTLQVSKKNDTMWIWGIVSAGILILGYMTYKRAEARRYYVEEL